MPMREDPYDEWLARVENVDSDYELLQLGVDDWNEVRGSYFRTQRADLAGADLRGIDVSGAVLIGADLSSAMLAGVDVSHTELDLANLSWANLEGADLSGSSLKQAALRSARFAEARLSNANLSDADLTYADLRDADLRDADLSNANLTECDLTGADLTGARLHGTRLIATWLSGTKVAGAEFHATELISLDLSRVVGLDDVVFRSRPILDLDTFELSGSALSDTFLIECGVPKLARRYLPSLMAPSSKQYYSAFISHSHIDKDLAQRIHARLVDEGIAVWLAGKSLTAGDDIRGAIVEAIATADRFILLASRSAIESWWVDEELESARAKERRLHENGRLPRNLRVVLPVDVDGFLFSDACPPKYKDRFLATHMPRLRSKGKRLPDAEISKLIDGLRVAEYRIPDVIARGGDDG